MNGKLKFVIAVLGALALIVGSGAAWGTIRSDVDHNQKTLERVFQRLDRMDGKLDRLLERW